MAKGSRSIEEVLAALGLDQEQRANMQDPNNAFAARIMDAFDAAGKEDSISVTWRLSRQGLARLRGMEASMRLARLNGGSAGGKTLAQMQKEYSQLLTDRTLYEPAEFSVESKEEKISSSRKVLAYSQSQTLANIGKISVELVEADAA